ncbi:MAG: type IX secretion system outer membrane channel protein PorV [Cyclobacteriaceae bacterium]|nr:type IX secretion system outer membrane channel protein PorV [Cyclobacteriaceae bacterium]UYN88484.1 MAG: type IX secretion system outer membrane channel protein PorV [Cyclobacteriaceae bacterium]
MKLTGLAVLAAILLGNLSFGQSITGRDSTNKVITTAVPFLTISPDARSAALGDAGAASAPDANAAFWNPAKLVFVDQTYGGSISYTPWLGKIINDMWISYLTGYYKITREQAVALSMKYFDLGDISFRGTGNEPLGDFRPREFSLDLTYSRMLTENLSVGLTGRYIHSNLTGAFTAQGGAVDARPGRSAAADIGVYYNKPMKGTKNNTLALAAVISNIGAKLSYTDNDNTDFLPTNLRLGAAYTTEVDMFNSFSFILDFNKLMVPTIDNGQTVLGGMFSSFTDAPGGFAEEMKEFIVNTGVEYWYNKTFAGRAGYFLEAREKGNRKYMTLGVGFRKDRFGIDVAYIVPTNKREHPLAETLRFSLLLQVEGSDRDKKSVTD